MTGFTSIAAANTLRALKFAVDAPWPIEYSSAMKFPIGNSVKPARASSGTLATYLASTACLDADHPAVTELASRATRGITRPDARAVALYYVVRDEFWYDPYAADFTVEGLRASTVIDRGRGFCVAKAGLLVAAARAAGIPARPGFADVRNHLATPRLLELMGTDVFYYHGYAELLIDDRWVKATPAFNAEMCAKFGVRPLDFDGHQDSLLHPYDTTNRRHMEYLRDHGWRDDIPVAELREAMERHYPHLRRAAETLTGDFAAEAVSRPRRT